MFPPPPEGPRAGPPALAPAARNPGPATRPGAAWRSNPTFSDVGVKHCRRVELVQDLALSEIHVHPARQAGVEAPNRPHDVDALEVLRLVLLEDRRVLDRVLVGAGLVVDVPDAAVPRGRRVGVVVGDLAAPDDHVVAEHAPHGLGET